MNHFFGIPNGVSTHDGSRNFRPCGRLLIPANWGEKRESVGAHGVERHGKPAFPFCSFYNIFVHMFEALTICRTCIFDGPWGNPVFNQTRVVITAVEGMVTEGMLLFSLCFSLKDPWTLQWNG